jgi:protein gp37
MAENSTIEWTDATWNPVTGCSVVSPGCTNCYAMKLAGTRLQHHPSRAGLTAGSKAGPVWNGKVRLNEEWLTQPLRWKRPRMIFVCAHGDLFHESVLDAWIDRVFAVMALAPRHTFQVLTKRAERMRDYLSTRAGDWSVVWPDANPAGTLPISRQTQRLAMRGAVWPNGILRPTFPLPNVWLGVSVEDQARADERIPHLLATPAAVRFVSAEPLLGAVDLSKFMWPVHGWWRAPYKSYDEAKAAGGECGLKRQALVGAWCTFLDWVIVGGESGKDARPMHPDWARSIRDQCAAAGVPFFFKQWGEWRPPASEHEAYDTSKGRLGSPPAFILSLDGTVHCYQNEFTKFRSVVTLNVGKSRAGRLLDGVEHNGMPEVRR